MGMATALVIDDSRPVRGILRKMLESLSLTVFEAGDGAEALTWLAQQPCPDLILVNWEMPKVDGITFVRSIRGDPQYRDTPIIMVSGNSSEEEIHIARRAGVNDYLVKPCTPLMLHKTCSQFGVLRSAPSPGSTSFQPVQPTRSTSIQPVQPNHGTGIQPVQSATPPTPHTSTTSKPSEPSTQPTPPAPQPIGVLIVDDSSAVRNILARTLLAQEGITVVGKAVDGVHALELATQCRPDIVLLDVEMPRMDGLTALVELRKRFPSLPVLMFSSLTQRGAQATTDALLRGADDFVAKPGGASMNVADSGLNVIESQLVPRIRQIVQRRRDAQKLGNKPPVANLVANRPDSTSAVATGHIAVAMNRPPQVLLIGVSTGGPAALAELIPLLPSPMPIPTVIVQHMPPLFTEQLARRLAETSGRNVVHASEGMPITNNMVIIAAGGHHLKLRQATIGLRASLTEDPPINGCRPSVDVLFQSAVACNLLAMGVVLTGMGHDGLDGARAIHRAGGLIVVQDEASSVVWGMPGAIAREGLAYKIGNVAQIAKEIARRLA
jgi:two-component system, chemotaxis family, protein-glutamate methylesterase/glutaminase